MNSNVLRAVLHAMIVNDEFLRSVAQVEAIKFNTPYAMLVSQWCLTHYTQYGKAPKSTIENIFDVEAPKHDEDLMDLVATLLEQIDDYDEVVNVDYLLDALTAEVQREQLLHIGNDLVGLVERGDDESIVEAEELVAKYKPFALRGTSGFDPFHDDDVVKQIFEMKTKPLILMPGAFGELVNDYLTRDSFIGILGPEKRGKSWVLLEFAFRALTQGNRVAFFEAGDMSQAQLLKRLCVRIAGLPMRNVDCGDLSVPNEIVSLGDERYEVMHKKFYVDSVVNFEDWREAKERFMKRTHGFNAHRLMVSTHATDTLSVDDMYRILDQWERVDGFIPDVIILDYADILSMDKRINDHRHKVSAVWKSLRRLSQEKHVCLVTGTQANAASYTQGTLNMGNFSEDKGKNAHVTGMLGLNQSDKEKLQDVLRVNWVVLREGAYHASRCVALAQQLKLGRAACASCWV